MQRVNKSSFPRVSRLRVGKPRPQGWNRQEKNELGLGGLVWVGAWLVGGSLACRSGQIQSRRLRVSRGREVEVEGGTEEG